MSTGRSNERWDRNLVKEEKEESVRKFVADFALSFHLAL